MRNYDLMFKMMVLRIPKSFYHLFNLELICGLIIFCNLNCLICDEIENSAENASNSYFNDGELSRNDSYEAALFNQSFESFNESNSDLLTNFTNLTQPDPVVTEDWGSTDKSESNQKYLSFTTSDEDICTCDLNSNYCDINCCCDPDCSEEDMKVFSKCHSRALVADKNYCYQKDIIFKNNTVYKMVKDPESSLFCILHDNLKEHLRFKELPVLKSHQDLDVLLKYQSKLISSWSDDQELDETKWSYLKAGSPIRIEPVNIKPKSDERSWNLPAACFTRMCSCHQEIHYLEDFNSFCFRTISNLREECQTDSTLSVDSYTNICISSRTPTSETPTGLSNLIAHTKARNTTNQCILIRLEMGMLRPRYSARSCLNVVSGVHFTILHNGFSGMEDISVKFSYINISEDGSTFRQRFSVRFEWNNSTDTERRSGNPGYQVGFPILTGTNSSAMDVGEPFEITTQTPGLSVLDRDASSRCSTKRRVIGFGKNFKTSCLFGFLGVDCKGVQERILSILLGSSRKQVFIGVFGNANGSNVEDWIKAYHEDREVVQTDGSCNLITGLAINVAFAAVGTVVNPQYKILGVGYHYTKPQAVDLACLSCRDLKLSTSVSFFDVTEPTVPHYPKVPSIKANLPSDFFYPFLYGKQANHASNVYLVMLMYVLYFFKTSISSCR